MAAALNLPLVVWEDLHEVGGIFVIDDETGEHIGQPGKSRSELAARFPQAQLPSTLTEDGWWNRSHEAVDLQARRAQRFVNDLIERHGGTDDRVAVVSHGGFYNFVLAGCWVFRRITASGSVSTIPASRVLILCRRHRVGLCQSAGASASRIDHVISV